MVPESGRPAPEERRQTPGAIRRMFESVAPGYDRMNRVLSLGMDQRWRRTALRDLAPTPGARTLDLCCGTGDLALGMPPGSTRVGCDFTPAMLGLAARKADAAGIRLPVVAGDALRLPFRTGAFDRLIVGFGVRNLPDHAAAFSEMRRVLAPEGRLVILEFSQPEGFLARLGHRLWMRLAVPVLARLGSPGPDAYDYLRDSVLEFPEPGTLARRLEASGFPQVSWRLLSFGAVAVHTARLAAR